MNSINSRLETVSHFLIRTLDLRDSLLQYICIQDIFLASAYESIYEMLKSANAFRVHDVDEDEYTKHKLQIETYFNNLLTEMIRENSNPYVEFDADGRANVELSNKEATLLTAVSLLSVSYIKEDGLTGYVDSVDHLISLLKRDVQMYMPVGYIHVDNDDIIYNLGYVFSSVHIDEALELVKYDILPIYREVDKQMWHIQTEDLDSNATYYIRVGKISELMKGGTYA